MKLLHVLLIALFALMSAATAGAAVPLMERIKALEPNIAGYPPNVKNEEELAVVKKRYADLKKELDTLLSSRPGDEDLLYMRGFLQSMGHNLDSPGAWEGADKDFKALLEINPAHVPAMLDLGNLWVNSNPALAPNAEKLFRAAQCLRGEVPLERAQQGLFFALYYQAKMSEAFNQSQYLVKTWPNSQKYRTLNDTVRGVLEKNGKLAESKILMATCEK
ncbi:hypothetical protein BH11PSE11_BH11PSE11_26220 [soil metagenome]